jgi:Zn-dependent protease with chaperone function
MVSAENGHMRLDATRWASLALAVTVQLPGLAFALLVVLVLLAVRPWPVTAIVAALLALCAYGFRPRLGRLPRRLPVLHRTDAPTLFGVIDQIARELGTSTIDDVVIDASDNAGTRVWGLRRHRMLQLGLPLWYVLSAQERVALLGHELGHGLHGDLTHGLLVGSSLEILQLWNELATPHQGHRRRRVDLTAVGEPVIRLVWLIIRVVVTRIAMLQLRLSRRAQVRAEYRADAASAQAASSTTAMSMLEKLLLGRWALLALNRAVRFGSDDIWSEMRAHVASVPQHERERLRRLAARTGHRVDSTHPPTTLRIEALARRPQVPAAIEVTDAVMEHIGAELHAVEARIARDLADRLGVSRRSSRLEATSARW